MRTAIPALCIAGASHLSPIQTPPNDPRTAAVALLPNGLRTLLVQDPSASRAAFSLTFNVGSWDDPVELPGMAHWSEHSLFLGSFAHDKPSAFDVFLSSRGGRVNAYTSSTQTVFFASLVVSGLADGLSRFSALFRLPSLHADRVIREVHNVNSEHSKNLSNDVARMWEIIIDHLPQPFDKFATGTQNSLVQDPQELGIDSPLKLKRFVSTHYCARNAAAAVISPLDMEAILPAVEATFGRILPDKHGQCRHAPRVLTGDIQAASFKMKGAVPTTVLAVPLPASRRPMFASLLGDTLSSLVRDTCLQNTGKVSSFLDVHIENPTSEFPLLALAVPMDDNIDAVRSVVAALLSLLKNVRKGEHKNYFEKATSNAKKRESLTSPSSDLLTEAGSLSSSLALVHSDEEMSGVFSSFAGDDAELWTEFSQLVKGIQVETPLVVWMTRQPVKPDHVEPWYKTPYEDVDLLNSPELIRWTKQPAVEACANHKLAKSKMKLLRTGSLWSGGFRTAIPTTTVRLLYTAPSETDMLTLSLLHQYISHSMDTFTSSKIGSRLKDCGVEISAGYTPVGSEVRITCRLPGVSYTVPNAREYSQELSRFVQRTSAKLNSQERFPSEICMGRRMKIDSQISQAPLAMLAAGEAHAALYEPSLTLQEEAQLLDARIESKDWPVVPLDCTWTGLLVGNREYLDDWAPFLTEPPTEFRQYRRRQIKSQLRRFPTDQETSAVVLTVPVSPKYTPGTPEWLASVHLEQALASRLSAYLFDTLRTRDSLGYIVTARSGLLPDRTSTYLEVVLQTDKEKAERKVQQAVRSFMFKEFPSPLEWLSPEEIDTMREEVLSDTCHPRPSLARYCDSLWASVLANPAAPRFNRQGGTCELLRHASVKHIRRMLLRIAESWQSEPEVTFIFQASSARTPY